MSDISATLYCIGGPGPADPVLRAVQRAAGLQLRSQVQVDGTVPASLQPADADVALLLLADGNVPAACVLLDRLRAGRCACIVLAPRLQPGEIERLIAHGACDFLAAEAIPEELLVRVRHAVGRIGAAPPLADAPPDPRIEAALARGAGAPLIGCSPAFQRQLRRLPVMAGCEAGVLILGETGTGKELCARAVHYTSPRASGPWVAVNCGAIPDELVEDELFGHVRGAYTHAHAARSGLVAEAQGGTLFLDEIDALPLPAQAKLLRFLQEKEYRPVGSSTLRRADVRVIAACNGHLDRLVAQGRFRQDLLFRLNVLTLHLPPLRERREDIAALALHFFDQARREAGRSLGGLTPVALRRLVEHDWPGNVRELKHTIERAVLLCEGGLLRPEDIEFDGGPPASAEEERAESFRAAKARAVESFERQYLLRTLAASGGNITQAARLARKDRRAFFELIRKHQIDAGQYRAS